MKPTYIYTIVLQDGTTRTVEGWRMLTLAGKGVLVIQGMPTNIRPNFIEAVQEVHQYSHVTETSIHCVHLGANGELEEPPYPPSAPIVNEAARRADDEWTMFDRTVKEWLAATA